MLKNCSILIFILHLTLSAGFSQIGNGFPDLWKNQISRKSPLRIRVHAKINRHKNCAGPKQPFTQTQFLKALLENEKDEIQNQNKQTEDFPGKDIDSLFGEIMNGSEDEHQPNIKILRVVIPDQAEGPSSPIEGLQELGDILGVGQDTNEDSPPMSVFAETDNNSDDQQSPFSVIEQLLDANVGSFGIKKPTVKLIRLDSGENQPDIENVFSPMQNLLDLIENKQKELLDSENQNELPIIHILKKGGMMSNPFGFTRLNDVNEESSPVNAFIKQHLKFLKPRKHRLKIRTHIINSDNIGNVKHAVITPNDASFRGNDNGIQHTVVLKSPSQGLNNCEYQTGPTIIHSDSKNGPTGFKPFLSNALVQHINNGGSLDGKADSSTIIHPQSSNNSGNQISDSTIVHNLNDQNGGNLSQNTIINHVNSNIGANYYNGVNQPVPTTIINQQHNTPNNTNQPVATIITHPQNDNSDNDRINFYKDPKNNVNQPVATTIISQQHNNPNNDSNSQQTLIHQFNSNNDLNELNAQDLEPMIIHKTKRGQIDQNGSLETIIHHQSNLNNANNNNLATTIIHHKHYQNQRPIIINNPSSSIPVIFANRTPIYYTKDFPKQRVNILTDGKNKFQIRHQIKNGKMLRHHWVIQHPKRSKRLRLKKLIVTLPIKHAVNPVPGLPQFLPHSVYNGLYQTPSYNQLNTQLPGYQYVQPVYSAHFPQMNTFNSPLALNPQLISSSIVYPTQAQSSSQIQPHFEEPKIDQFKITTNHNGDLNQTLADILGPLKIQNRV